MAKRISHESDSPPFMDFGLRFERGACGLRSLNGRIEVFDHEV